MQTPSIGDTLFTKTQQRVLGLLYGNPDKRFYANEIVRWAGMGRGTVRRELERLLAAELLVMERMGNQQYYQANPDTPVFVELHGLVMKTFGIGAVLRQALLPLAEGIETAFVHDDGFSGSGYQIGALNLVVVGEVGMETLIAAIIPCQHELEREINPLLMSLEEFLQQREDGQSLLASLLNSGVEVILGKEPALIG